MKTGTAIALSIAIVFIFGALASAMFGVGSSLVLFIIGGVTYGVAKILVLPAMKRNKERETAESQ